MIYYLRDRIINQHYCDYNKSTLHLRNNDISDKIKVENN